MSENQGADLDASPDVTTGAGRDQAADGVGDLEPSIAEGSPDSGDDVLNSDGLGSPSRGPAPAGGPGSDDADRTGPPSGTVSGGEVSAPLG